MKKNICYLIIGIFLGSLIPMQSILADNPIKLIVNGVTLQDSLQPINFNNHVYVSARSLSEALGASVTWDSKNNAVKVNSNASPTQSTNKKPLVLDSKSETTYKPIEGTNEKIANVTVSITNTSDKYESFRRLVPILSVNDGRSYMSALDPSTKLEGGYYKPYSTITLKYWTQIPNDIDVTDWVLYK